LRVVLKLGGSIFDPEPSGSKIREYVSIIKTYAKKNQLVAVTGGGSLARRYIATARELGASEAECDQIGIYASRLNARLLAAGLGDSVFPEIPDRLEDLLRCAASGLVVVMGGLQPGQSTNAAAALAAEIIRADLLVNATNVDGVYSADPRKDSSARKLDKVTPEGLEKILSKEGFGAGEYALMDPLALRIIKRSEIPVIITDGRDPSNIEKAMNGKRIGTRIMSSKGPLP